MQSRVKKKHYKTRYKMGNNGNYDKNRLFADSQNFKTLAVIYKLSYSTFLRNIKKVKKELKRANYGRRNIVLTPRQILILKKHLGDPENNKD